MFYNTGPGSVIYARLLGWVELSATNTLAYLTWKRGFITLTTGVNAIKPYFLSDCW
jgi:hypothetical protein